MSFEYNEKQASARSNNKYFVRARPARIAKSEINRDYGTTPIKPYEEAEDDGN